MCRKYLLRTLGCKVNQYESQQIREALESLGLRPAQPGDLADLAVVNTCAVTAEAAAKTRQAVRRVAQGGQTPTLVVGCGAIADETRLRDIAGVQAVWGHEAGPLARICDFVVHRFGAKSGAEPASGTTPAASPAASGRARGDKGWISPAAPTKGVCADLGGDPPNFDSNKSITPTLRNVNEVIGPGRLITRFEGHERAFLKIQDGCDAFCTYCIIPRLRTRLSSKPIADVVAEARALVAAGHREIVLTGVFLGAYGRPTAIRRRFPDGGQPLAELVDQVACVEGLARLRLSSLEPGDVTAELLDVLAAHDCCVPHLHLPLQSGSPGILRRMNRQYTADEFLAMIERVRNRLDRPAISTDILVGFPGETEEDFEATTQVAKRVGFCKIHTFPFSPREGTAAARWRDEALRGDVVRDRLARLRDVETTSARSFREQFIGSVERVLIEHTASQTPEDPELLHGRADRYFQVHFAAASLADRRPGQIVRVRIDRVTPGRVHGTRLDA